MRIVAPVVLAAALAGCASYAERLAQEPIVAFETAKSVRDFEGCAIPPIRDMWPGIGAAPDGAATVYTYPVASQGAVLAAISITPTATGSRVELRSATSTGQYRKAGEMLRACQ